MNASSPTPPGPNWRRAAVAFIALYVIVVFAVGAYRAREDQSSTSDFDDFWLTARQLLQTGRLVEDFGVHNYPPFFGLFIAPLGVLPLKAASVVFNALSLAGFALSAWLLTRRSRVQGESNSLGRKPEGSPAVARWIPILPMAPFITDCLVLGQMALLTLAMVTLSWHSFERRRDLAAGFWTALAVSTKVYPAVLVGFFLLKRRYRAALSAAAWLILLNGALPLLVWGGPDTRALYAGFWRGTVVGHSALRLAVAPSDKMSYANQSAALLARRFTRPTDSGVDRADGTPWFVNLIDWGDAPDFMGLMRAQWVVVSYTFLLLGGVAWVCRRPAARLDPSRLRLEFASFVLLGLLLSPIVWTFYFALCYLPLAVVVEAALSKDASRFERRLAAVTLAVWAIAALMLFSRTARMCGVQLVAAIVLYFIALTMAASRSGGRVLTLPAGQRLSPRRGDGL